MPQEVRGIRKLPELAKLMPQVWNRTFKGLDLEPLLSEGSLLGCFSPL